MTTQELRELDAWIAEHVMAWKLIDRKKMGWWMSDDPIWETGDFESPTYLNFQPTENQSAAMDVLKKCAEETVLVIGCEVTQLNWTVSQVGGKRLISESETLELAICLFAKQLFSQTTK